MARKNNSNNRNNIFPTPQINVNDAWNDMNNILSRKQKQRLGIQIASLIFFLVIIFCRTSEIFVKSNTQKNVIGLTKTKLKTRAEARCTTVAKSILSHNSKILMKASKVKSIFNRSNDAPEKLLGTGLNLPTALNDNLNAIAQNLRTTLPVLDKNEIDFYQANLFHVSETRFPKNSFDKKRTQVLIHPSLFMQLAYPGVKYLNSNFFINIIPEMGILISINNAKKISLSVSVNEKLKSKGVIFDQKPIRIDSLGPGAPQIVNVKKLVYINGNALSVSMFQKIGKIDLGLGIRMNFNTGATVRLTKDFNGQILSDSISQINKAHNDWKYVTSNNLNVMAQLAYAVKNVSIGIKFSMPLNSISTNYKNDKLSSGGLFARYSFN